MKIKEHFKLLGFKVRDRVTGFNGVASSISFDLYGCVQVAITPEIDKDGKTSDGHWFDVARLELKSDIPVMDIPNYDFGPQAEGKQGAAEKPKQNKV